MGLSEGSERVELVDDVAPNSQSVSASSLLTQRTLCCCRTRVCPAPLIHRRQNVQEEQSPQKSNLWRGSSLAPLKWFKAQNHRRWTMHHPSCQQGTRCWFCLRGWMVLLLTCRREFRVGEACLGVVEVGLANNRGDAAGIVKALLVPPLLISPSSGRSWGRAHESIRGSPRTKSPTDPPVVLDRGSSRHHGPLFTAVVKFLLPQR